MLGFYLDPSLSFAYHLDKLQKKLNSNLYFLNKVRNILPEKSKLLLYHALIHSHLHFSSFILSMVNKQAKKPFINLQKNALRFISNSRFPIHTSDLFEKYRILPLTCLIDYNIIKFMWEIFNKKAPKTFENEKWTRIDQEIYALRRNNDFQPPISKYARLDKFTLFSFPKKWDDLPLYIKSEQHIRIFLANLRIHLKHKYNQDNKCQINSCQKCKNFGGLTDG